MLRVVDLQEMYKRRKPYIRTLILLGPASYVAAVVLAVTLDDSFSRDTLIFGCIMGTVMFPVFGLMIRAPLYTKLGNLTSSDVKDHLFRYYRPELVACVTADRNEWILYRPEGHRLTLRFRVFSNQCQILYGNEVSGWFEPRQIVQMIQHHESSGRR